MLVTKIHERRRTAWGRAMLGGLVLWNVAFFFLFANPADALAALAWSESTPPTHFSGLAEYLAVPWDMLAVWVGGCIGLTTAVMLSPGRVVEHRSVAQGPVTKDFLGLAADRPQPAADDRAAPLTVPEGWRPRTLSVHEIMRRAEAERRWTINEPVRRAGNCPIGYPD